MGQKVLLADDSITVQKIVKLSLTEEGIEVIAFGNGEQAVSQIEQIQPDLVMADVFMPGKDGYEVCEYVKAHPHLKHVPVILLVHAFEPFDPERAKEAGADHQLTKPFQSIRTLVTTVQDLLARPPAQPALVEAPGAAETAPVAPPEPPPAYLPETAPALSPLTVFSFFGAPATPHIEAGTELSALETNETNETNLSFEENSIDEQPVMRALPESGFALSQPAAFGSFDLLEEPLPAPPPISGGLMSGDLMPPFDLLSLPAEPLSLQAQTAEDDAILALPMPASFDPIAMDDVLDIPGVLSPAPPTASPALAFTERPSEDAVLASLNAFDLNQFEETPFVPSYVPPPSFTPGVDVGVGTIENAVALPTASAAQDVQAGTSVPSAAGFEVPEAVIEEIVNRVVQRLSTKAIQEIAWEVIPEMAELMIRKQISQQKQLSH